MFLITPEELTEAIKQMEEHGLDTKAAHARLALFQKNPVSPIIAHKPSGLANDAINLGRVNLQTFNRPGRER